MSRLDTVYNAGGSFINLGLERIKVLLHYAGNPQDRLKTIHVAGTNGKGSVSMLLSNILTEHGLRVGLYTSPHLTAFAERITVNNERIKDNDIERLDSFFQDIILVNDDFKRLSTPSFFELTTAVCFQYFFEQKVDIAIIEAGLGGRLDATNVIKQPLISIITNVAMDHKNILGNSLKKIALEKAGIIKKNSVIVSGDRRNKTKNIIGEYASGLNAAYFSADDVKIVKKKDFYDYYGLKLRIKNILLNNKALYQKYNLRLGIFSAEILNKCYENSLNLKLNENSTRKGISKFYNEGRFEIIKHKNSDIVLDGAHNPEGIRSLILSLRRVFSNRNFIIIFAVMKDKDYETILRRLSSLSGELYFIALNDDRALSKEELNTFLKNNNYFKNVFIFESVKDALESAVRDKNRDDVLLVCGSFRLLGEFKRTVVS
ncbi:bifunctional folylpolyglutamate synthase/dihydrofolate synthase [Candidatus Acidulodesulfobacterium sp. H_13]|uniref:bifunctional folylpolyglutamate synthase/dihydrofolate synthase n=1 Tax=Candidatus Acidulodesulfobacterium sp. H_13 TaxID=3395470 RepID=UPI003AF94C54